MTAQDHLNPQQFYHGTPDERTWDQGKGQGIHVGTHEAARQALEARIGAPATGDWDGTREYGKTPLVSNAVHMGYATGLSARGGPKHEDATYGARGDHVPMDARPSIFPVAITGPMVEGKVYEDFQANGRMAGQLKRGNAKRGLYYGNAGEDVGSISAVVPSAKHLKRL